MTNIKVYGEQKFIERRRRALGLSRDELSRRAYLPNSRVIEQWEQGKTDIQRASALSILSIAKVLRCSPLQLMDIDENHPYYTFVKPSMTDVRRIYHVKKNTQRMTEYFKVGCCVNMDIGELIEEHYSETNGRHALAKLRNTIEQVDDKQVDVTEYWLEEIKLDEYSEELSRKVIAIALVQTRRAGARVVPHPDLKVVCGYNVYMDENNNIIYGVEKDDAGNLVKTFPYHKIKGEWVKEDSVPLHAFRRAFYTGMRIMK